MNWFRYITPATLLIVLLLAGCATPTPPTEMVPQSIPEQASLRGVAIQVTQVTGGMETRSWDVGRIGNAEFRQALEQTLRNSGVDTAANGKSYQLSCEIVSQNVAGTFDNTMTLLVHYTLKDDQGKRIWADNILTEKELAVKDVFNGQTRMRKLQTSAIQDNFITLLDRLAQVLGVKKQRINQ